MATTGMASAALSVPSSNASAMASKVAAAPRASLFSPGSGISSRGLSLRGGLRGLRRSFFQPLRSSRPASSSSRRSFSINASQLPLVGNPAPDFEAEAVFDQEFIKNCCHVCRIILIRSFNHSTAEIAAFSDRYAEFETRNTEVLGVSVDSVFSHLAWVQTDRKSGGLGDLKYPLVSDVTKSIAKSYGVLIPSQGIALRGLFIIDKEGVIQHSTINNLAIGRSVDETLRTLQALQYVQENPDEVCPAGWKPGEKSMKPDPKLSKEYFAAI
ncbi:hypothetical protein Taro_013657 [Colocasia esculenta]|uniref:thioredoxin-dependent peroxiredoxin n=1 Tax=Colocasia esculenta TaxID=4460 RepID=A0A843UMS7_COLES|nr:hypothetical protein [Colocasia esculenta]